MSHTCWLICQKWEVDVFGGVSEANPRKCGFYWGFAKDQVYPNLEVVPFVGKTCSSHARRSINFWVISLTYPKFSRRGSTNLLLSIGNPKLSWRSCFIIFVVCYLLAFCWLFWTRYQWTKMPPVTTVRSRHDVIDMGNHENPSGHRSHKVTNFTTDCYLVVHPTARKWVINPIISGLTLLIPFITGVITYLLSGMSHQVSTDYHLVCNAKMDRKTGKTVLFVKFELCFFLVTSRCPNSSIRVVDVFHNIPHLTVFFLWAHF